MVATADSEITERVSEEYYSKDAIQQALTLIVATKANWWATNHHTGQGAAQGYALKAMNVYLGPNSGTSQPLVTAVHTIGHWASTLMVLNLAGIQGIRRVTDAPIIPLSNISLAEDAKLRFSALPAGTHRLGVAYESAKRLVKSVLIKACPSPEDFRQLPISRNAVVQDRASHHIGASYLTGRDRVDYNDSDFEAVLGRLGCYIVKMFGRSTLAKSPHMLISKIE